MTSFHPTLSPLDLSKYLWQTLRTGKTTDITSYFPDYTPVLTDSGKSAFAVIVESLNLRGKHIALPAYVCDSYYPVLRAYDITPHFLDIDMETYQPALSLYTDELLDTVDAVLLIATYGRVPDPIVISHLKRNGATIIEDYAMRSPLLHEPLQGAARLYSLPKTIPVPDGGLALIPKDAHVPAQIPHTFSTAFIKNVLKLLPLIALLIARVRSSVHGGEHTPSWHTIGEPSNLTKSIVADYVALKTPNTALRPYPYCHPMLVAEPDETTHCLRKHGVHAERIWWRPIVANPEVQEYYQLDATSFPITEKIAAKIVCTPLWHIGDTASYETYQNNLEKTLAECARKERVER